ncbi:MAG: LPS export ABC transporter periplasmic protein LptC [Cytophagales bacterium CG18_big_fil_WC_8_21_14_2_50_42_9]|nr:MAG: LPS export ABC transporter periplasmic protein LptC [Cytophagales bacterium CG18_big_fil_WC_8_21_14_2_50_42_9]
MYSYYRSLKFTLHPALLFAIVFSVAACKSTDDEDLKKKVVYKGPISQARDVATLYSDSARLQIKLSAPLQLQYENGDGIYPKGINVIFYDKQGRIANTVRANYGKYDKRKDSYFAQGNVIVNNVIKDETMRTEELHWDKQKRRLFTDKFVTIQTKTDVIKGHGLTANQDFSNWKISKTTGFFSIDSP